MVESTKSLEADMDIWQQDAENAAAAMEAMNEQTANWQQYLAKRPSQEELLNRGKAGGYYEPKWADKPKEEGKKKGEKKEKTFREEMY